MTPPDPAPSPALVASLDQLAAGLDDAARIGRLAAMLEARCRPDRRPPRLTLARIAATRLRLDADRLARSCAGCDVLDPPGAELVLLYHGSPRLVCPACLPGLLAGRWCS